MLYFSGNNSENPSPALKRNKLRLSKSMVVQKSADETRVRTSGERTPQKKDSGLGLCSESGRYSEVI